jgi:hypothetical protein
MTREAKTAVVSLLLSPLGCASRQVSPHVVTGGCGDRDDTPERRGLSDVFFLVILSRVLCRAQRRAS